MRNAFQILCCILFFSAAVDQRIVAEDKIDFSRQIRPILSAACYQCHGPDEKQRQAALRLDQQESLLVNRDVRPAVVPGNHTQSELFHRISSNDPEMRMPPPDVVRQLTEEEIELLKSWINQGADWETLWSLQPVRIAEPPGVLQDDWPRSKIDQFVLARLEAQGLTRIRKQAGKH